MQKGGSRDFLKSNIVSRVYSQEITSLSEFSEKQPLWVMDFKSVSTDRFFLESFVDVFDEIFGEFSELQVCGMESGALPFITAISLLSSKCKNTFYIRKSSKKHDLAKLIEGDILPNTPIIIVDDVLNGGNTFNKQRLVLADKGFVPSAYFSILRFRDKDFYKKILGNDVVVRSVFDLDDFKGALGLENKRDSSKIDFNHWIGEWRIKLSRHNPYLVIPKSAPIFDENYIYVGSDDGCMRSISKSDGKVVWEMRIPFGASGKKIFSSPVLLKDEVFFGGYDGNFYCLDKKTGKKKWIFSDADWIGSSPSVSSKDGLVYIGLEFGLFRKRGGIAAIDTDTGEAKWKYYDMSGLTHASPVVNDKMNVVVCGCNNNFVYCFDSIKGNLLWEFETKGEVKYGAVFDEKRNLVIIGSMDGNVYCIDARTGKPYHVFPTEGGAFYSNPALYGNTVIIGCLDKNIYCFDLSTKQMVWKRPTRARIFSSPALYEESVFVGTNEGAVYELDSRTGNVKSLIQTSERIVNKILIDREAGKRVLYIPTHACEIYKFIEK